MEKAPHIETTVIHIGQEHDRETGAVIPPIYATSTFAQLSPGVTRGYDYTRSGNPTFSNLQRTLAAIENARYATVFASGMAAITAVLSSLEPGSAIVAEENIYGCTYRIIDRVFHKFGIHSHYFDLTDPANIRKIPNLRPRLVWIESPTNPSLKIIDIAAVAAAAHESGASVIVDNTFASPYFQKPLDLGADLSLSSTTKYINGHSDCLGGVVAVNRADWHERMVFAQKAIGLNPSPFDAWLISRGVKTLPLRMERHHQNALAFTEMLAKCPLVRWVRYPFHPSHPQYTIASRQMTGGSGMVSAEFKSTLDQTKQLISAFQLFTLAESLGGIESLVCHPASMTHASIPPKERRRAGIPDGLVRFSVGIEHIDDLIEDFNRALEQTRL